VDKHDKHRVTIYNIQRKLELVTVDGSKSEALDMSWSKRTDDLRFVVVGPKELNFWHPADVTKKLHQKGTFGKASQTSLLCAAFDEEGWCYTGGENGLIQVWSSECTVAKTIKAHADKVVSITTDGNKLISGSKDQKVAIISIAAGGNFKLDKLIDLSSIVALQGIPLNWPKSVDYFKGNLLVGLRNGTILEVPSAQDAEMKEPRILCQSHFEGETWGLQVTEDNQVITCGDDNRIMMFDANKKQFVQGGKISDKKAMKDPSKKSLAATTSQMAPNK